MVTSMLFNKIMKSDIIENDNNYEINIEIPGVKKENVKISLSLDTIEVSITKTKENKKFISEEINSGTFSRKFYVGKIAKEDVDAMLLDGVLTLIISKSSDHNNEIVIKEKA